MKMQQLLNKKIFLAPYNAQTLKFANYLENNFGISIQGYFDREKKGALTFHYDEINPKEGEHIIILSPNYAWEILQTLLNAGHLKEQISFALPNTNNYSFSLYKNLWHYLLMTKMRPRIKKLCYLLNINYLKLFRLKMKHQNKRAFIVANGPSLQIEDLEKIQNEITFACNKIYLAFEQTNWRPSYYFVTDGLVYMQNYEKINELQLTKLFSTHMLTLGKKMKNAIYFPLSYKQPAQFVTNALSQLYSGSTVTYVMLEFAVYMGIKEIYIIGLDFNFELPQKHHSRELSCEGEVNHFHKEYRKVGEKWTMPDLEHQRHSFLEAKKFCDAHGIKVYNASRESKLGIFGMVNFETLF